MNATSSLNKAVFWGLVGAAAGIALAVIFTFAASQYNAASAQQNISAERAGQIAAAHVNGTVDSVDREWGGDYGAKWDVDVYSPEGEYIIYVSSSGEIVHVEGPYNW